MMIFYVVIALLITFVLAAWIYDLSFKVEHLDNYKQISSTNIHQLKSALDSAQKKIEALDRKSQTAYDIANNAMLREKRVVTVRLKRVKSRPKVKLPDPPPLLKKSGLKADAMETWT